MSAPRNPGATVAGHAAAHALLAIAAVAVWIPASSAAASPPRRDAPRRTTQIVLAANARTNRPDPTLGDVAGVSGADPVAVARIAALRLGALPRDGTPVRLERAVLARWIRARIGTEAGDVEWKGPAVSELALSVSDVSGALLADRAMAAVRDAAVRLGLRADIVVRRLPGSVRIPAGALSVDARPVDPGALRARRVEVWLELKVDAGVATAVPVWLDVAAFGPGWVAKRRLTAGETVDETALEVREVEWTGRDPQPVGAAPPSRLRLLRPMAEGDVLTRTHCEPVPFVRRGSVATLHEAQGRVELERPVEVLDDGRAGESVRVRAASSSAAIVARVTGPDRVEVRP